MPNNDSHQHVVKTTAQWQERAIEFWIIPRGCLCIELTDNHKTLLKIGEGNKIYSQLPYITGGEDLSQYITEEELQRILNNLNYMAIRSTTEYDDKTELPLTGNKLGDVRFVKSSSPSIKTDPDVYLWNGRKWIFVGYDLVDIDLSQYIKRDEFDPIKNKVNEMYPKMHTHSNKDVLDQITAPFTIPEKEKLAGLENYDDTEIRELIHETGHTHPNKNILDRTQQPFTNADKTKLDSLENYDDSELRGRVEDVEAVAHQHTNLTLLEMLTTEQFQSYDAAVAYTFELREQIPQLIDDVDDLKTKVHTHSNKDILDSTTAPYTIQQQQMLIDLSNITIFDGAGPTWNGMRGYVPAPQMGEQSYFLRGDGTWAQVKSGSGDKYKAGDGIYILSGETAADSFPFNIYSTANSLEEYIIYGSANGVGDWDSNLQKYVITITVSSEGKQTLNHYIPLDSQLFEGDYIVYSRGIFVHYKTNLINDNESLANSGIDENGGLHINQPSSWYQTRLSAVYEVSDEKSYLVEYDKVYSDPGWYGYYQWNINLYNESMNVTRTIRCRYTPAPFNITPTSSEKYIRVSYPYAGDAQTYHYHFYIIGENVEPISGLPRIIIYSNAVNTINVTTTNKPSEIYVKVAEDEGGGTTPEADFTGIIYNDGVLDITQEDPNALNELTVHFRESDKVITVPAGGSTYIAGDGIDIDANDEISAKLGSGLQFDANGAIEAIGGRIYVAGEGIMISDSTSFELSEDTITNTDYFFDTRVTSSVLGRTYTKYNTEPALGAVVYYESSYTQPFFVGLTADSVKYGTDWDSQIWPNPDHPTFEYKGVTWYYSGNAYGMRGDGTDASGHMQKLPGDYSVSTEADLQNIAKAIIDAADIITDPTKIISVKIGEGLSIDQVTGTIQVDVMTGASENADGSSGAVPTPTTEDVNKFLRGDGTWADVPDGGSVYIAGDGIDISRESSSSFDVTDPDYYFDTNVQCGINGRTFTKYTTEPALAAILTSSANLTGPFFVGLSETSVAYAQDYDSTISRADGSFEYLGYTWYYTGQAYWMSGSHTDSMGNIQKITGITPTSESWELAAKVLIDTAGVIPSGTEIISTKIGAGLRFDSNNAIEAIPYTLPTASASTLGGVKVGDGLDIDANGVLEVDTGTGLTIDENDAVSLVPATTTTLGGVIVDAGLQVAADGKVSVKYPYVTSVTNTQGVPGSINVAKYDGTSTDVDVLDGMRMILNCNFDSSRVRNPLGEPVNAPASGETIDSPILGDLTVLEVNE